MKTYRGSCCVAPPILTPALNGGEWSSMPPSQCFRRVGGCVDPTLHTALEENTIGVGIFFALLQD